MGMVEVIKDNFNKGFFGKAMLLEELPSEYPAWTIKRTEWFGVAVPLLAPMEFSEHFSKVKIWTANNTDINGMSYDLLLLTCDDMNLRNEFSTICAEFVLPGKDGVFRKDLVMDPKAWWEKWKFLLGNVNSSQRPYAVMGELLVLERLLRKGKPAIWTGADGSTHDIELPTCSYEVKSTTSRYGYEVTISSIHQMKKAGETLDLVFCRFEKSNLGRSTNEIVASLINMGYNEEALETSLRRQDLEKGCTAREEKYKLLEMRVYAVDENFPAITYDSFVGGILPKCITKFSYAIDLSGIVDKEMI